MEDEAALNLDGKNIANLRVVDLKHELEKRGLSKSGSKKDLVKRLKQQVEFEKLCGERKSSGDCDLKLELDADTEQNEFVQQYLAQQQKIYAEQKEVKRLIELEGKSNDEKESCDSTKGEDGETEEESEEEVKAGISETEIGSKKEPAPISPSVDQDVHSTVSPKNMTEMSGPKTPEEVDENIKESPVDFSKTATISGSDFTTNMEISTAPFSLSDIQLPESPGKIKLSSVSDPEPSSDSKPASEVQSNGVDSTSTEDLNSQKRKSTEDGTNSDLCKASTVEVESLKTKSSEVDDSVSLQKHAVPVIQSHSTSHAESLKQKDNVIGAERAIVVKGEKQSGKTRSQSSSDSDLDEEQGQKSRHKRENRSSRYEDKEKHVKSKDKKHKSKHSSGRSKSSGSSSERKAVRRKRSVSVERADTKKHTEYVHKKLEAKHVSSSSSESDSERTHRSEQKDQKIKLPGGDTFSNSDGEANKKGEKKKAEGRQYSASEYDSRKLNFDSKSNPKHQENLAKEGKYGSDERGSKKVETRDNFLKVKHSMKEVDKEQGSRLMSKSSEKLLASRPEEKSERRQKSVSPDRPLSKSPVKNPSKTVAKLHEKDSSQGSSGSETDEGPSQHSEQRVLHVFSSDEINKSSRARSGSREKSMQKQTVDELGEMPKTRQRSGSGEKSNEDSVKAKERTGTSSLNSSVKSPVLTSEENKRKRSSSQERSSEKSPIKSKDIKHKSDSQDRSAVFKSEEKREKRQRSASRERSHKNSPIDSKDRRHKSSSQDQSSLKSEERQRRNRSSSHGRSIKESSAMKSKDSNTNLTKELTNDEHSDGELSSSQESISVKGSQSRKKSPMKKETSEGELSSDSSNDERTRSRKISVLPTKSNSGTITVIKKEPPKQRLKIKRDNVIVPRRTVPSKDASEKDSDKKDTEQLSAVTEPSDKMVTEQSKVEPPVVQKYVSRKINISGRKLDSKAEDEPKSKKSKWGSFATAQRASQNINISSDSLKTWFPDFKMSKVSDPITDSANDTVLQEEAKMNIPEPYNEDVQSSLKEEKPKNVEPTEEPRMTDPGEVSKILFVQNLVRPFTLNQLKTLLNETGRVKEDSFWIDKIKSKCFVTYETEEEAEKTRLALNGTRWPTSNPKILSVEFSTGAEMEVIKGGNEAPKPQSQLPLETHETRHSVHPSDDGRKKDHSLDNKRDRSRQPLREWDQDKITQDSPVREYADRRSSDRKERKDTKKRVADETPAKLLDDLFQKTKSTPCIYWLPLTDEMIRERAESRRLRKIEREKRNQAREQEEEEQRTKRERSPHRPRDKETKRSPTRSRSPLNRRR